MGGTERESESPSGPLTKNDRRGIIKTQAGACKTQSVYLDGGTKEKYK